MSGVGGRPELVLEGIKSGHNDWREYNFLYKPGNLSAPPPFVGLSLFLLSISGRSPGVCDDVSVSVGRHRAYFSDTVADALMFFKALSTFTNWLSGIPSFILLEETGGGRKRDGRTEGGRIVLLIEVDPWHCIVATILT